MKRISKTIREFVAQTEIGKLPLLTAAAQTKRAWATAVESYEEVPEIYKSFFDRLPHDQGTFPFAVLTPTFEGFLKRENQKLVCSPGNEIYILEKGRDKLDSTCYRLQDINYVEVGSILLQTWIKISGVASNGVLSFSMFRFSAASERLFVPLLQKIRAAAASPGDVDPKVERAKFDYLADLSLKFLNYARASILSEERVVHTTWQPRIQAKVLTLLGKPLFRTLSVSHLSILTDTELILIRDNPSKNCKYGAIKQYVPLNRITSISLTSKGDDLLVLSIGLPEDDHLESLFATENRQEAERFLNRFNSVAPLATVL